MPDLREYYKDQIWDIGCCWLLSAGLTLNVFAGYDSPDPKIASIPLIFLVCAVMTVLLFAAGINKQTTIAGIGIGVATVLASVIYVRVTGVLAGDGHIDDSPALFWLVTIGTSAACYLLSRWRIGTVVLLVIGVILTAAFCFLDYPVHLLGFLLFIAGTIVIFLYRVYSLSLLKAYTGKVRFHRFGAQSAALALAVMILAGGIYQGIIVPLDPPTQELKLITVLQSFDLMEKLGVSKKTELPWDENQTQQENDEEETSNEQTQEDDTSPQKEMDEDLKGDIDREVDKTDAMGIRYDQSHKALYVFLFLMLAALLASPFVLKRLYRKRWEEKVKAAGPTEGSLMIFDYLMRKLRYAGFTKPDSVTLSAYMEGQKDALQPYATARAGIPDLAKDYQRVIYGYRALDEQTFSNFWSVYEAFRGNLKKKIGLFRYALRFFTL